MYNPERRERQEERQEERQDRQLRGCPMIKCLFTGSGRAREKNLELHIAVLHTSLPRVMNYITS